MKHVTLIIRLFLVTVICIQLVASVDDQDVIRKQYESIVNSNEKADFKRFVKNLISFKESLRESNKIDALLRQKLIDKVNSMHSKIQPDFIDRSIQNINFAETPDVHKLNEITFIFDYFTNYNKNEHFLLKRSLHDLMKFLHNSIFKSLKVFIILPRELDDVAINSENASILRYSHGEYKYWSIFGYLINLDDTKYIFFGDRFSIPKHGILDSSEYALKFFLKTFQSLLSALETNPAANAIAGGFIRNANFEIASACAETTFKYYGLKYTLKQPSTKTQYCDYVFKGNFLASKRHIVAVFNELLYFESNQLFFNNMFIQFKLKNYRILYLPNVVTDVATNENNASSGIFNGKTQDLLVLMQKYELELLTAYDEQRNLLFKFKEDDCDLLKLNCKKNLYSKFHALPRCCRDILTSFMKRFESLARLNSLVFELDSGTLLGAVKFSNSLPWEIDGDLSYFSEHHERLRQVLIAMTSKYGYYYGYEKTPVNGSGGAFIAYAKPYWIELYGMSREHFKDTLNSTIRQTKVAIDDKWISSPVSPGLWVRNRYGLNLFKHALSWRYLGLSHSFESYSNKINNAFCPKLAFHSCMSALGNDGNYQYTEL